MGNDMGVTKLHVGYLKVQKEPHYIVEMVEDQGNPPEFVTVYKPHPKQKLNKNEDVLPRKAFTMVEKTVSGYSDSTVLGKLAKRVKEEHKVKEPVENPPIFMTAIVWGVDTFTGKEGWGFYEHEQDITQYKNGKPSIKHGAPTGVFISLDSIIWEKTVLPLGEVLDDYKARKTLLYL